MKYRLLFVFGLFLSLAHGQDSSFVAGNEAYANGDYEKALKQYNKIIGAEKQSAALFYNLGNTYYKLDEIGEAIWAYEKVLKINPGNKNALKNLELANAKTIEKLDQTSVGIGNWLAINFYNFSINFWAILSIVASILLAVSFYIYRTTRLQKRKNIALSSTLILMGLFCFTIFLGAKHKAYILKRNYAVIVADYVDIKPSPSETAPTAFQIFEGTKVTLKRSNDNWVEIEVNGNTGWVLKDGIWEI
ncbi:tetratricopeptide repeat protein [Crocinitomix algicola]|uniref:tetratricopeptide repeat protein n=1 Tax=Crocinitomix algicola TaxID=1740263 RepID=UPI00082ABD11|nr:tetratricopeptide repeat protein [Crocinitomix algicola]